jgi:uncharacterized membrane protein
MLYSVALFLHLIGFAAFVGSSFAQQRFLAASMTGSLPDSVRDAYERIAAAVVTKGALPAIFLSLISGVVILTLKRELMQDPWMHTKLTAALLLVILAHLEMFNARRIVRARSGGAVESIPSRKARHRVFAALDLFLILVVLVVVAFGLRGWGLRG